MKPPPPRSVLGPTVIGVLLLPLAAAAEKVPVVEELQRLSAAHGFRVIGLQATQDAIGRAEGDELYHRLRRLLEDFDHVIVQSTEGGVERVIVLGEKVPFVPVPQTGAGGPGEDGPETRAPGGDIVLETERRGTQHGVQVSIEGSSGKRMARSLLVDTGADFVVLPRSLVSELGIAADKLQERQMQTANGKVKAGVGVIPAVWLGDQRVADVTAAFIEDSKLGNGGLLGMSVLSRYTMTIDDEAGRLTLAAKTAGAKDAADRGTGRGDADAK
jgi:clan AA aspartic protease (TIGR02281 family)